MLLGCTAFRSAHHLGVGPLAPAHTVQAGCAVASSSRAKQRHHSQGAAGSSAAQHLWASSVSFSWEVPVQLGEGEGVRTGLTVRLYQTGAGRLGKGSTRGQARASRLPGREAAATLSSTGTSVVHAIGPRARHTQY